MDAATMQLIISLLPVAENIIFTVGGKLIQIATSDLNTPTAVEQALADAKSAGFPQLTFLALPVPVVAPAPVLAPTVAATPEVAAATDTVTAATTQTVDGVAPVSSDASVEAGAVQQN